MRFRQRLDTGGAAIDGHQERRAARGERSHRFDIRPIAFEQPIRNMDERLEAGMPEKARQQRRRSGTVDIVIAEDRDRLAAHDGVGDPAGGLAHSRKHMRIGHIAFDRRIEECVDTVHVDVAAGKDARKQFGNFVTLRDRERPGGPALVEPVAPCSSRRRMLDAEEVAVAHRRNAARFKAHPTRLADS